METDLLRLAESGSGAYPPEGFDSLAEACREAGGFKPRLMEVAAAVDLLAAAWEPFGALRTETVERLDRILTADLPTVIREPDESAAISLARSLREALALVLLTDPPM